eukprot:5558257-Prymnesium_polylepis.1
MARGGRARVDSSAWPKEPRGQKSRLRAYLPPHSRRPHATAAPRWARAHLRRRADGVHLCTMYRRCAAGEGAAVNAPLQTDQRGRRAGAGALAGDAL